MSQDRTGSTTESPATSLATAAATLGDVPCSTATCPPSPPWNLVHFDVPCARCGQDLRGLSEPKCPACSLDFDWSDAVPLEHLTCLHCGYHLYGLSESRCPECGTSFSWNEVLTAYQRTRSPLFEYRFRSQPVRSLIRAFRDSLQPRSLWNRVSLHDPPRVSGLLLLWITSAAIFVLAPAALGAIYHQLITILEGNVRGYGVFFSWQSPYKLKDAAFAIFGLTASTSVMFLTLASMHWSLKACRVRRAHVFRICVYLTPFIAMLSAVLCTMMFITDVLIVRGFVVQRSAIAAFSVVVTFGTLAMLIFQMTHVARAYKQYIRMRHAWGIAIAANIAAFLAALTVSSWRTIFFP